MTIGEKIYTLRTKSGMTQEQLAEKMGVSRQAISKWESDVSVPELSKLKLLANLFQVTLDELMDEKPLGVEVKKETMENDDKAYKSFKLASLIQSAAIVILGVTAIVLAFNLKSLKDDIWVLQSEIARLSNMISIWEKLIQKRKHLHFHLPVFQKNFQKQRKSHWRWKQQMEKFIIWSSKEKMVSSKAKWKCQSVRLRKLYLL